MLLYTSITLLYLVAHFKQILLHGRWLQVHAESFVCSEQTGLLLSSQVHVSMLAIQSYKH